MRRSISFPEMGLFSRYNTSKSSTNSTETSYGRSNNASPSIYLHSKTLHEIGGFDDFVRGQPAFVKLETQGLAAVVRLIGGQRKMIAIVCIKHAAVVTGLQEIMGGELDRRSDPPPGRPAQPV